MQRVMTQCLLALVCLVPVATLFAAEGPPTPGRRSRQPMLQILDVNGDGDLSADELAGANDALQRLDTNRDGTVSRGELRASRDVRARGGAEEEERPRPAPESDLQPERRREPRTDRRARPARPPAPRAGRRGFGGGGGFGGGPPPRDQGPSPLIAALDSDRNGRLSKDEISNAAAALAALDRDGDDELSTAELLRPRRRADGRRREGPGGPQGQGRRPDPRQFLQRFDGDGDGVIQGAELPERMRRQLERIDSNGDGGVDREELEEMFDVLRERFDGRRPAARDRSGRPRRPNQV